MAVPLQNVVVVVDVVEEEEEIMLICWEEEEYIWDCEGGDCLSSLSESWESSGDEVEWAEDLASCSILSRFALFISSHSAIV